MFFFQAEDGIRDLVRSRGLGDVYKRQVVRIEDGEVGLSARTIKRRLATIAGLYDYLIVRGDVTANPVPRGLATRRGGQRAVRGLSLIHISEPTRPY